MDKPAVVLVVEDEVNLAMLAADLLEEGGFRVIEAYTADQALQVLVARSDVRAVFTDVDMPGALNGLTLAWIVDKRWPGTGIVVTSGKSRPRAGALPDRALFVAKPYTRADLLGAIQTVLKPANVPGPIRQPAEAVEQVSAPVLPASINVDHPHTGIGHAGGLAEPTPEPEE